MLGGILSARSRRGWVVSIGVLGTFISISTPKADAPPAPQIFIDVPAQIDPAHPLKIGPEFYPAESVKLRQEGRCVVRITVDKTGAIHDPQIVTSSGFERLDAACIAATTSGHLFPALKNGNPIESTSNIPIIWTLPKSTTLAECMAIPASVPFEKAQADHATGSKKSTKDLSGKVVLRLFISESGAVGGIKVDQSSGSARLDDASVKGVTGQTMKPAMAGGEGIATCVLLPIVWKLQGK